VVAHRIGLRVRAAGLHGLLLSVAGASIAARAAAKTAHRRGRRDQRAG